MIDTDRQLEDFFIHDVSNDGRDEDHLAGICGSWLGGGADVNHPLEVLRYKV